MAITEEDIQEVLAAIKEASQDVKELEEAATLDGVSSLPAVRGDELVSVPLALLQGAVLDLGSDFDSIAAFEAALGTEEVIRSGKSLVVGRGTTEGYESLYLCIQAINANSGTGRQYVFANNNSSTDDVNGWRVRSISGVRDGSYTLGSWEATMPHRFWLNGNRYLEVGDYRQGGSGTGAVATVDLSGIFTAFSVSDRTAVANTVTATIAGAEKSFQLAIATSSYAGLMSATDKAKLDGLMELPVEAAFDAGTGIGMELTADSFDPAVSTELTDVRIQYCGGVVSGATTVGGHRFFLVGTDTDGKTVARSTWDDNAVAGRPGSWAYNADSDPMGTARLGVLFRLDGTTERYYVDAVDTTSLTVFTQPSSGSSGGSSGGALTAFSITQSALMANFSITVGDNTLTARLAQVTSSQAGLMRASDYTNLNNVVEKAAELEEEITAIKEDMGVTLPAVVSFDGVDTSDASNLNPTQGAPVPVFYDTYEAVTSQEYDGDPCSFTPTGVYWCSAVKEPDNTGTVYGQHRFFLIGTLAVPHTSEGTSRFTVAVKTWEDGDVSGYLGSWAYNEDDDANGYARKGVLFQATDGTLYYRAYGSDSVLTELVLPSESITTDEIDEITNN